MRSAYPIQDLIQKAGNGAKYPLRVLLLFAIQWMICSMIFNGRPFLFDPPQPICYDKNNATVSCTIQQACNGTYNYTLSDSSIHSLVYSFDLLCDYEYWSDLSGSAMFLGGFLGSFYYSEMQEKNGRHVAINQSLWVTSIAMIISVVSINVYLNILALLIASFGMFAYLNNSIIYFIEISSDNLRIMGPNLFLIFWALGEIVLAILHVWIQSWRLITLLIMGIPLVITLLLSKFLTDSPRYLVSQEKFAEARECLAYIAKYNDRQLPEYRFENEDKGHYGLNTAFFGKDDSNKQQGPLRNFMTLFKYDSLKATAWALLIVRTFMSIANQGSILSINSFHGHTNSSVLTSGVVQLFGYLIAAFTTLTFRRKPALKTTYIIIGVIYLAFYLLGIRLHEVDIDEVHGFIIFLVIFGRLAVCVGYSTMLIYITEVMPTTIRHHAHGLFACVAYFMMIFIDSLVVTMRKNEMYPQFWMGLIFIALWQVMTYIPETQGHALYEQIKEEDSSLMNREMI